MHFKKKSKVLITVLTYGFFKIYDPGKAHGIPFK